MGMVTVAQLREYLNQKPTGTTIDTQLEHKLERAESIVTTALGFSFFDSDESWAGVSATQKIIRSEVSRHMKLKPYQYGSITSVAPATGSGDELELGDAITNYDETESGFYLYRDAGWAGRRWAVTAKWGYGPADPAIVELVLELAVNIDRQAPQGLFQVTQGVASQNNSVGGGSLKYVGGLNSDQRRIVANVRRRYIDLVH